MTSRILKQTYEEVPVDSIKPHPKNPRKGSAEAISESMDENGFFGACLVQKSTGYILVGNHRWKAARQQMLPSVPIIWLDVDDKQARKIMLADNAASDKATYDDRALAKLLQDTEADDRTLRGTGYKTEDLDELIRRVSAPTEPLEDFEDDPGVIQDDLWEETQGVDAGDHNIKAGRSPESMLEIYNNHALRQIMLVMSIDEYSWALGVLESLRKHQGLDSNTEAVLFLLKKYEAARAKKEQPDAGTEDIAAEAA